MPKASEKQIAYMNKYIKEKYDRVNLTLPHDSEINLDAVKAHAIARGESVNAFINRAISEQIQRDMSPEGKDE